MSHIRSKETKPEMLLRKELFGRGFRYRKNYKLPGKPDIVFTKKKVAVFCDGCFWHACSKHYVEPKTNRDYWIPKIRRNVERDREVDGKLEGLGWQVIRIWECEILDGTEAAADRIEAKLKRSPAWGSRGNH